jgi:hypothetical protein
VVELHSGFISCINSSSLSSTARASFLPTTLRISRRLLGHLPGKTILRWIIQYDGRKALFYLTAKMRHGFSFQLICISNNDTCWSRTENRS